MRWVIDGSWGWSGALLLLAGCSAAAAGLTPYFLWRLEQWQLAAGVVDRGRQGVVDRGRRQGGTEQLKGRELKSGYAPLPEVDSDTEQAAP